MTLTTDTIEGLQATIDIRPLARETLFDHQKLEEEIEAEILSELTDAFNDIVEDAADLLIERLLQLIGLRGKTHAVFLSKDDYLKWTTIVITMQRCIAMGLQQIIQHQILEAIKDVADHFSMLKTLNQGLEIEAIHE